MFKATIIVDNIADHNCRSEWGLCVHIEYNAVKYLLDTGGSDLYLKNAELLGIRISDVDHAVLSHAHIDHSGGYRSFFRENSKADLMISCNCSEDCYFKFGPIRKYVGIPKGILGTYSDRVNRASGLHPIEPGVWLVPHLPLDPGTFARHDHMYRKIEGRFLPDSFDHEQSLVFETDKGLVVLNSCSHAGLPNIVHDIRHYLPGREIYMTIGGLHLAGMRASSVREIAREIKDLKIKHILTGHCTGQKAYSILRDELGEKVQQIRTGMQIEV